MKRIAIHHRSAPCRVLAVGMLLVLSGVLISTGPGCARSPIGWRVDLTVGPKADPVTPMPGRSTTQTKSDPCEQLIEYWSGRFASEPPGSIGKVKMLELLRLLRSSWCGQDSTSRKEIEHLTKELVPPDQ